MRRRRKRWNARTNAAQPITMSIRGKPGGDVNDYHMILDTSELGAENCADILMRYFRKMEYI